MNKRFVFNKNLGRTTRDPNRIPELLAAIGELWEKMPDCRLIQLLDNVTYSIKYNPRLIEDDDLLKLIQEYKEKYKLN